MDGKMADMMGEFIASQRAKGVRSLRKTPYLLARFFTWLEAEGITAGEVGYARALGFQSYLLTLEDVGGNRHYAPESAADILQALRRFFAFLSERGEVAGNPFAEIPPVKRRGQPPRDLPDEEVMAALLDRLRDFSRFPRLRDRRTFYRLHVAAELLYASGLRISELAALRPEDLDLSGHTIMVREGKGGRSRRAYLSEYASRVLSIYLENMRELVNHSRSNGTVFGVKSGRDFDKALNGKLKAAGAALGIPGFTCHAIRHTLGYHLLRSGADMRYIQLILGHEDLDSTSLYTLVEKGDLRRELDRCHPRRWNG